MMYPDYWPNNHILNTLLVKLSESVFGIEPWSVRLPNLLAFIFFFAVMYAAAVRYFAASFFLFLLPFAAMFCNPFLLDFCGLDRGYGISNALMASSLYFLLIYISSPALKWHSITIILSMLAVYANFSLLIYWVALNLLFVFLLICKHLQTKESLRRVASKVLVMIIVAVSFLGLCYLPLHKMSENHQFNYVAKTSFFHDTILDQVENFRYGARYFGKPSQWGAYAVLFIVMITGIIAIRKIMKAGWNSLKDPLIVLFLLLLMVWLANICQSAVFGTSYLSTRTALSYYVLFTFVFIFLIKNLCEISPRINFTLVPLLVILFCLHLMHVANYRSVREWWYDANTYQVMDYLKAYQKKHPEVKTIALNTNWLFNPSFNFYTVTGKAPWLSLANCT